MKKLKTILRTLAVIIIVLLPFLPISESFFEPNTQIDNQTLSTFIAICLAIIFVGFVVVYLLKSKWSTSGILLLLIGFTVVIPLHLGVPRMDESLLTFAGIEQFRYGLLLLATLLLFFAGLKILNPIKSIQSKIFFIVLIAATLLNLWDNYSSFMLSTEMKNWVADGKSPNDFLVQFNFQITWRTLARIGLYLTTIVLIFSLLKQLEIRKWQFITLSAFCVIGIIFCILCLLNNFENFYFPFMIPAIALAPAYWAGIALLTNRKTDNGQIHSGL